MCQYWRHKYLIYLEKMQERKFSSASDKGNKFSGLREVDETTEDCQNYHKNYLDVHESFNMKKKSVSGYLRSNKGSTNRMLFPEKWERMAVQRFVTRLYTDDNMEGYKKQPTKNERDLLKRLHRL